MARAPRQPCLRRRGRRGARRGPGAAQGRGAHGAPATSARAACTEPARAAAPGWQGQAARAVPSEQKQCRRNRERPGGHPGIPWSASGVRSLNTNGTTGCGRQTRVWAPRTFCHGRGVAPGPAGGAWAEGRANLCPKSARLPPLAPAGAGVAAAVSRRRAAAAAFRPRARAHMRRGPRVGIATLIGIAVPPPPQLRQRM